jgi:hypothetical protein
MEQVWLRGTSWIVAKAIVTLLQHATSTFQLLRFAERPHHADAHSLLVPVSTDVQAMKVYLLTRLNHQRTQHQLRWQYHACQYHGVFSSFCCLEQHQHQQHCHQLVGSLVQGGPTHGTAH